jgi:hypothetical protein
MKPKKSFKAAFLRAVFYALIYTLTVIFVEKYTGSYTTFSWPKAIFYFVFFTIFQFLFHWTKAKRP